LTEKSRPASQLNPELRARLLQESKSPFRGLRRALWIALFGSSLIGLFVMVLRTISGGFVSFSDAGIQLSAILIFGSFLFFDKESTS